MCATPYSGRRHWWSCLSRCSTSCADWSWRSPAVSSAASCRGSQQSPNPETTMRRLVVFNQVSLDGYIADEHGDMSWAHKQDPEWNAFAAENASGEACCCSAESPMTLWRATGPRRLPARMLLRWPKG